jgi:hypothetical protein
MSTRRSAYQPGRTRTLAAGLVRLTGDVAELSEAAEIQLVLPPSGIAMTS